MDGCVGHFRNVLSSHKMSRTCCCHLRAISRWLWSLWYALIFKNFTLSKKPTEAFEFTVPRLLCGSHHQLPVFLFNLTLTWSALLLCWPSSRSWRLSGSWQMPQKIQLRSRFDCFSLSGSVPPIQWSPMLPHPTRSFWSPCFLFIGRSRNDAPRGFQNGL